MKISAHGAWAPTNRRVFVMTAVLLSFVLLAVLPVAKAKSKNPDGTIDKPIKGVYDAQSSFYQAHITVSDVDNDGVDEILVGNVNGQLYCFTPKAGLKWNYNVGGQIQGAPACADVDGDKKKEVFVGDLNGWVWGFDCRGNVLSQWGWPKQTPNVSGFVGVFGSPAIGDINGDGALDVVAGAYGHTINAWSYSGGMLPGWPYLNKDTIWSSPAIADIDYDGLKEVIIGADSTGGNGWPYPPGGLLYVFNGDGSVQPGFPKVTPEVTWSSPAVADIDNDGWQEIIVGTGHYYKAIRRLTGEGHYVYAYNHDGSPVPGWPVPMAGSTFSSPAVGDVNGDGVKEIAIACNPMYGIGEDHITLLTPTGQKIWDIKGFGGPMMGSPAMGDITGDGLPEVLIGSGCQMCAYDLGGRIHWSQNMHNFVVTSPAVGDFDGDGNTEVAVGTGDAPGGSIPGGAFYIFNVGKKKTGVTGGDRGRYPWPMFHLNDRNSGTILTGKEPPPPPPPPPPANFHEYILLMNPGTKPATAEVTLMNEKAQKVKVPVVVGPRARSTVFVNKYMSGCGVSAKVTSNEPIISERAMYFNFQGRWQGGTDSSGAPEPSPTWYLAEGYTADNFDEYVLVQNPQTEPAHVKMTFMVEGGRPIVQEFDLVPESRFTLNLKGVSGLQHANVSTKVEASRPVIAERSMYFNYNGNIGGHDSIGVTDPAEHWYLAEGYTAQSYDTYVLVQNPNEKAASVELKFLRGDGYQGSAKMTLPPTSRKTVRVDDIPGFQAAEVSTEVVSSEPVIAERAMYFNADGRDGGHDSVGVSEARARWYLAEGYTGGSFDTYTLVMNPNNKAVTVKTTLMRQDGHTWSRVDRLAPRTRFTIHLDEQPGFADAEVSTLVEGIDGAEVIAERAMYFVYNGIYPGGHDACGVSEASKTWYFAEGYTGI